MTHGSLIGSLRAQACGAGPGRGAWRVGGHARVLGGERRTESLALLRRGALALMGCGLAMCVGCRDGDLISPILIRPSDGGVGESTGGGDGGEGASADAAPPLSRVDGSFHWPDGTEIPDAGAPPTGPDADASGSELCPEGCGPHARCDERDGCVCADGFERDPDGTCVPIDSCAGVRCGAGAYCDAGECRCEAGFVAQGDDCVPADPCADVRCGQGAFCDSGDCRCLPGFVAQGEACVPAPMNPLEQRTEAEVCARWISDRVQAQPEWIPTPASNDPCDLGSVPEEAMSNAVRRTNLYRWLAGLAPVGIDAGRVAQQQACAVLLHGLGHLDHHPPANAPCYTPEGAAGAGSSNLAFGAGLADSVGLYVSDRGVASLGHRLWVLNPSMRVTAFGYRPQFSCMYSFSTEQAHAAEYVAWPPPGFVPAQAAQGRWHVAFYNLQPPQSLEVAISLDGGPEAPAVTTRLDSGYGRSRAVFSFDGPAGAWSAGRVARVRLGNVPSGEVQYTVRFVACR